MTAKDYPVTFPYGATTAPYSPAHPHTGEDRKMPLDERVAIEVNGVVVGYAGTTGNSTGIHTHTQRQDKNGKVIHPQGGGFDVSQPTIVTATGFNSSIGNFVRYKDGNGETWSQFHMDSPAVVRVGQQLIEEEDMPNDGDVDNVYLMFNGRKATNDEKKVYTSKPWSAGDGLFYGKVQPEVNNLNIALAEARKGFIQVTEPLYKKG